jgi:internalin A
MPTPRRALERIAQCKRERSEMLDLIGMDLSEIPPELAELIWLEYLNLSNNQIRRIENLEHLIHLSELNLGDNQISRIEGLEHLVNLSELDLGDNQISRIEGLEHLVNLSELYLWGNQISRIEGLEHLVNLSKLSLFANRISQIEGLERLVHLSELYISTNKIRRIEGLGNLVHLSVLYLSENQISHIEGLGNLVNLSELYLSENKISRIEGLEQLKKLHSLNLNMNKISSIEGLSLSLVERLEHIDLRFNPIGDIPSNDLNNRSAILGYLKSKQEEQQITNQYLKINIIGEGRIGKTQLYRYLQGKAYIDQAPETHGTNSARYSIPKTDYQAQIWDFGGQSYHHGFHQIFIGRSDFNLVLWRKQVEQKPDYAYWLGTARAFSSDQVAERYSSPLLLVQNVWRQADKKTEPALLPDDVHYPNSGQMEGYQLGIDDVFAIDVRAMFDATNDWQQRHQYFIAQLHQKMMVHAARFQVAATWVKVKKRIDEKPIQSFNLSKEDFRAQYAAAIVDDDAFEGLLAYLVFVGNVLYFRENEALSQYIFPNPPALSDWLFRTVLDEKFKQEGKGKISAKALLQKLNDEELVKIFLELMKSFELIFEQPHCEKGDDPKQTYYIVPQFLPEYDHSFKQVLLELLPFSFALQFPDFVHEAKIFQFIAHFGRYAQDSTAYWKYGLLYAHPLANGERIQTLVYYHAEERRLMVHIRDAKGRSAVAKDLFRYFVWGEKDIFPIGKKEEESENLDRKPEKDQPESQRRPLRHKVQLCTQGDYYIDIAETIKNIEAKNYFGICVASQKRIKLDLMSINLLSSSDKRKLRIFFSYSHKDELYRNELEVHMAMLKRSGRIETWHDRKIMAGDHWDDKIKEQLQQADIVLLMISSDFLHSDYIWEQELSVLRHRKSDKSDSLRIIPIFTRPCDTNDLDEMQWQGAQKDKQSQMPWISSASDRDAVYADIVKNIRSTIEEMR